MMSYTDREQAVALESALVAGGGTTLSYIPRNSVLVAATPDVAAKVCSELGVPAVCT